MGPLAHPWDPGILSLLRLPGASAPVLTGKGCVCVRMCVSVGSEGSVSLLLPQAGLRT